MANMIAGLGAQLGLDTTEFKKGISEAKSSLKDLMEYLPEILTVAAFTELTKASIEYANQIAEVAKANDIATSSVLDLTKALEVNGGSAENVGRIYSGFTQKLEAAIQGNATAQTSFAKLGVSLNDLKHLDTQQIFDKTIKGLGDMKDSAERNGLAFMTMGKGIRGVDLKGLAETMEEVRGSSERFGNSIKLANEFTDKLKESSGNFKIIVNDAIIPSLNALYDSYTKTGTAVNFLHDLMEVLAQASVVVVKTITVGFSQLFDVVKAIGKWAWDFAHLDFKKAGDDLFGGIEEVKKDGQDWLKFYQDMRKAVTEPPKPVKHEDPNRIVTDAAYKQVNQAELLAKQYQNQVDAMMQQILAKNQLLTKTKNQQEQEEAINKVFIEQEKAFENIDKAMANLDKNSPNYGRLKANFEATRKAIEDITWKSLPEFQEAIKKNQAYQQSFEYGWTQAFEQYKESAMTAADAGKQAFTTVVDQMTNALDNFAKTGKLSFSSLAASIIQDLIKIQTKYQMTKLFEAFTNKTETSGFSLSTMFSAAKNFLGFANGGDPPVGVPSMVGENGPELFIPKSAGTVIPNNKLSDAMGGAQTTNVTNYNISAIDVKSFEERLLGSSNAIWAANQYAGKTMATNFGRT
jgi:hypothetical protein